MVATPQITQLRQAIAEPNNAGGYTDEALQALLNSGLTVNAAAGRIWRNKAGQMARFIDISEAGSSRSASQAYDHAVEMAVFYEGADSTDSTGVASRATTRRIVRARY